MLVEPSATPNSVRASVRRLVEEMNTCDGELTMLLGEKRNRKTRKSVVVRSPQRSTPPGTLYGVKGLIFICKFT
uniref:Uncharacterized protein n=1 Tax=Caenorhabditis japonica TaxID=281687 RepID=A0A8R1EEM0_CAEJA